MSESKSSGVYSIECKSRVRASKLKSILGSDVDEFVDLFKQGDPNMSLGVFDDGDRIYLEMMLAELGTSVSTLDHHEYYIEQRQDEKINALVRNIDQEVSALDNFDNELERAKAYCDRYKQMIYQMFGTHVMALEDVRNPVAVLCSEENKQFVLNCVAYYHGISAQVVRFLNTPEGFVWVVSPGLKPR